MNKTKWNKKIVKILKIRDGQWTSVSRWKQVTCIEKNNKNYALKKLKLYVKIR